MSPDLNQLPPSARNQIGTIHMMADWFAGYFNRHIISIIEKAANDTGTTTDQSSN